MTKNRKAKAKARDRATEDGTSYTAGRRADLADRRPDPDREPDFADRVHTALPWADVVLDCRRAYEVHTQMLPERLMTPTEHHAWRTERAALDPTTSPRRTVSGSVAVPAELVGGHAVTLDVPGGQEGLPAGATTLTAHVLAPDDHQLCA